MSMEDQLTEQPPDLCPIFLAILAYVITAYLARIMGQPISDFISLSPSFHVFPLLTIISLRSYQFIILNL